MAPSILWLLLIVLIVVATPQKGEAAQAAPPIARPNCNDTCGSVSIPFPFGMGPNCFLDSWFEIKCESPAPQSNGSPKPFLSKLKVEVVEIFVDTNNALYDIHDVMVRVPPMEVCTADTEHHRLTSMDLRGSPYDFSTRYNDLALKGCAGSAVLIGETEEFIQGCATVCRSKKSTIPAKACYGVECCRKPLYYHYLSSPRLQFYHIDLYSQASGGPRNCLAAALIKSDEHVDEYIGKRFTTEGSTVPLMLNWRWISNRPSENPDASCRRDKGSNTLTCRCAPRLRGNPYVSNGCQVPKGCKKCPRSCILQGNKYLCRPIDVKGIFTTALVYLLYITIGYGLGPLLIFFAGCWLRRFTKRRRKTERRLKFFKLMLQRHQASSASVVESTKVFTHKELDKATNHFNDNRVLGKGGQGTVYKGMLTNGKIVAIKRSILVDESQMEQFINEVAVLSQLNHRNVVKLLGCCLETKVPLLVYEFIPNGTLAQHIHHPDEDFVLSWPLRLQIAASSAEAVAYLHSFSSVPILHRDIKSANILLDEKYTAKVSDFGSSKTISVDQTHLTTIVQGTIGYLDPEYFESNQLTDKSDVYSFGVVLLELLTRKKPIYWAETMEQKDLVTEFFFHMQNSSLPTILDGEVLREAKEEEVTAVADLAKCCLNGRGKLRPTMKEVAMVLEMIIESPAHFTFNIQEALRKDGITDL